jgi:hypothetical protein
MMNVSNVINKTIKCEQMEGDLEESQSKISMILLRKPPWIRVIRNEIS